LIQFLKSTLTQFFNYSVPQFLNNTLEFTDFDLHPDLLDGLDALNFKTPTPIQAQAIPLILEGRDVIGTAQTGTGKTAAFVLPVLSEILDSRESNYVQALIIVPTRELASQIDQVIGAYSYFTGISSIAIYGGGDGKEFAQEKTAIAGGVDVIIATPGRLIAHINLGYVNFKKLRFLVLDEADRLLDMGFQHDLMTIIDKTNPNRRSLLFSATMPPNVLKFGKTLLKNPASVNIAISKPSEKIKQGAYVVNENQKLPLVLDMLKDTVGKRILVFCSSKLSVSTLYQKLNAKRMSVGMISSELEQTEREKVMLAYRNRQIEILVATDVVSRGIDVDGIDMVINFDVPRDAEDYVHRIGRTARAERDGEAVTLISQFDQPKFKQIEDLIGRLVDKLEVPKEFGECPLYEPWKKVYKPKPDAHKNSGGGGGFKPNQQRPSQGQKGPNPRSNSGQKPNPNGNTQRPSGPRPNTNPKPKS
jgi:ATP-dependent RNA helicase RhlE